MSELTRPSESSPDDGPVVDRCVCFDVSFAEIRNWAGDRECTTLSCVRDEFGCTDGCGLCRPFIRRVLETGEVAFDPNGP